ncbi:conserved hypothetical protein [Talaromyces stipitatus ATCC 10500]|uniref:Mus7/MMS22 family protein n=1 Tax=Talaromyces stipitatus (strain ATCC 10500 / CBS 375.48 / QM 6759 / NRRL 1006) TaxID=441959 RepID=B8LZK6_TALSN|nr:uncharacterized protein TSTA_096780 [Talaromyces stipitatus ATCC 10500]EED22429.1 conserved hypothetical protein [Talaromyces stipitatus ATCC 10500]
METWRNRGFVPDSDEDEDFESQESRKGYAEQRNSVLDDNDDVGFQPAGSGGNNKNGGQDKEDREQDHHSQSVELEKYVEQRNAIWENGDSVGSQLSGSDVNVKDHEEDKNIRAQEQHSQSVKSHLNDADTTRRADSKTTTEKSSILDALLDGDDFTSLSDDELQVVSVVSERPTPGHALGFADIQNDVIFSDDEDLSSISPPPSTLGSTQSSQRVRRANEEQVPEPEHSETTRTINRVDDTVFEAMPTTISLSDTHTEDQNEADQPIRRSFRARKEIQLHPYQLEDAKYKTLFRNAGIKPVRVTIEDAAPRDLQEESQESIFGAPEPPSSPASVFSFPQSSPVPCNSPASIRRRRTPKARTQLTPEPAQAHSQKRRKLFHDSHGKKRKEQASSISVVIEQLDIPVVNKTTQSTQFPPSPPCSGSLSSVTYVGKDGFRFPRGFIPPTAISTTTTQPISIDDEPMINDEIPSDVFINADDHVLLPQSGKEDEPVDRISFQGSDEEDEGEETEPAVPDVEVKQYQRKIKGVLPASWLTLDLRNKIEKPGHSSSERHQRSHSTHAKPQKGVARTVSRPRSTALQSPTPRSTFAFLQESLGSDDDSSNIDISPAKNIRKPPVDLRNFYDLTNDIDDDIPEDNRIDEMFPPVPRLSAGQRKGHLGKTTTFKRKQVSYKNNQTPKSRPPRQARLDHPPRPPKRKVQKPRIPKLSILDAPDVISRPRKEQPQFLRVATRQARSRKDQGRSSPSRKVFNMATREETKETNGALWDWKRGAMKQAKLSVASTPRSTRQPLQNLSTNTPNPGVVQDSSTEAPPRFLEELDLASENVSSAHSATGRPAKRQVISATTNRSRLVRRNVINRNHAITSLRRDAVRPAEFEVAGTEPSDSPYAFSASLAALHRTDRKRTFTLDRFIAAIGPSEQESAQPSRPVNRTISDLPANLNSARKKVSRKRVPTRAEISDIDPMPQITASCVPSKNIFAGSVDDSTGSSYTLYGFRNFRVFSVDFNILPIRKGTFFHDSTFIGEGGLSRSLNINARNMDQDSGVAVIESGDQVFRWGAWTEEISSELGIIFDKIKNSTREHDSLSGTSLNSDPFTSLTSVIGWITDKLHFIDPVDRVTFIERVELLTCDLRNHIATANHADQHGWKVHLRLANLTAILSNQLRQVAAHESVNSSKRESTLNLVKTISHQLLSFVFSHHGLQNIRQLYQKNQNAKFHESGIRDGFPAVEAYVILLQILDSSEEFRGWWNELLLSSFVENRVSSSNIEHLEEVWEMIFTTLPLNEIDKLGLGHPGLRFCDKRDNWPIVQALVSKVLDAYIVDPVQPVHYINYCRVVFQRCLLLMVSWGWRHCKGILGILFDFYAKNMMYNLKTEQSFGSPSFLESLDTNPTIEIEHGDSSFHLFLKIIASGLRYLSQMHDKKTMRNIAWRLLPNHGRAYPKEKSLNHEDLDALRNHHDLLCTLYWGVPDGCRPRPETIRNLIDPATSHLETCNLSIRSWRRLVHFKLSTNEEDTGLKPFADWYKSFTSEVVRQHQLAKTEVEAQAKDQMQFSKQDVELTVSHNQRRIEALISSTIAAMDSSIQSSRTFSQACLLAESVPIAKLFELFDPANSRVNPIISETLQLVITFLTKDSPPINTTTPTINDDSQDYGDWSVIEEVYDDSITEPVVQPVVPSTAFLYLQEVIQPCVSELLSNCFGEDRSPEDSLLLKLTEAWSCLAQASVRSGLQHWDSYLNPYSRNSWTTLRMTPQTKKFGPQFLANCIERDSRFFFDCRLQILTMWASSLVERTSALKFQHRLTEVLLNVDQTSLTRNLPFYRGADGRYHVTLSELTERRISLISSLLSNMREHLQALENSGSPSSKAIDEYREIVDALMTSMKTNYQELGQSGRAVQGQYVEFVHSIISLLQQHAQSICRLDKFFTDPATFPLPSNDPGYFVAKLKSYGVRLPEAKAAKELVNFMQVLCERAALDGRQNSLVDQLSESMGDTYECGNTKTPTLRSFLFHCLFPAYMECALSNAAAWILVLPIMKAVSRASRDLLYDIDINDSDCIKSVNSMFGAILQAVRQIMHIFLDHAEYTKEPRALLVLTSCVGIMRAMVPVLDYIRRNHHSDNCNTFILETLCRYTTVIVERLYDPFTMVDLDGDTTPSSEPVDSIQLNSLFLESRTFAIREIKTSLRNWSKHGERYFILRGRDSREINCDIITSRDVVDIHYAKSSFVEVANAFLRRWESFDQMDVQSPSDNNFEKSTAYELLGDGFNDLIL